MADEILNALNAAALRAVQAGKVAVANELKSQTSQGVRSILAQFNPSQGEPVGGKVIQTTFDETEPDTPMDGHLADDEPDPDEAPYQMFSSTKQDADENLALAVAAWRLFSPSDEAWVVAQHAPTGNSFAGRMADLNRLAREHRHKEDDWQVWFGYATEDDDEDEETIWDLPCSPQDRAVARRILSRVVMDQYDDKAREYAREHLGDRPRGTVHLAIPGITAPLVTFGVVRGIAYTASKNGKIDHYFHVSGESTGSFPLLLKLDKNTMIIHNPAGLVDDGWIDD